MVKRKWLRAVHSGSAKPLNVGSIPTRASNISSLQENPPFGPLVCSVKSPFAPYRSQRRGACNLTLVTIMLGPLSQYRSGTPPRCAFCRRNIIMPRAKASARQPSSSAPANVSDRDDDATRKHGHSGSRKEPIGGLRERKKARLREQIVETALHLFRQRGYEKRALTTSCKPRDQPAHFLPLFPQQRSSIARSRPPRFCAPCRKPEI